MRRGTYDPPEKHPYFNPRTPCGVRLASSAIAPSRGKFQSTHPLRGATPAVQGLAEAVEISIHAPLAGCDAGVSDQVGAAIYFNPRTPCGVRPFCCRVPLRPRYFNPRTPCGVRPRVVPVNVEFPRISIHAPLAGCDHFATCPNANEHSFNPRTPCGVRQSTARPQNSHCRFQSTHPLRGATRLSSSSTSVPPVSIHAPLAGCDRGRILWLPACLRFNPRTPCGVRRNLHRLPP